MIDTLHLLNFRKHENTRIEFSSDAQIVAVTGRNGMGKSTLLTEAILWALYGESRHGRRALAGLVRRGAEHEGMQVEMQFTVGNTQYRVIRRWEKGKHSAQLFANENLRVQTASEVTGEITRILGMDAVGFRLATVAKQKDLNGLIALDDAPRRKAIQRLLRLDAVQRSAKDARDRYLRERDVAAAMAGGPTVEARQGELDAALLEQGEADAALAQAREALITIDTDLAATMDVDAAHNAAVLAAARFEATAAAAEDEIGRLGQELDAVVIPEEMQAPARTLDEIGAELSQVDAQIARGEAAATIAQQAKVTARERDKVAVRIGEVEQALGRDTPATLAMAVGAVNAEQSDAAEQRTALLAQREDLLAQHGVLTGRVQDLTGRLEQSKTLGAVCDSCEQTIPHEHRQAQQQRYTDELNRAKAEAEDVLAAGKGIAEQLTELDRAAAARQERLRQLSSRQAEVSALFRELDEAKRRLAAYTEQLERLVVEEVDLEGAYASKGRLACERAEAEAFSANAAARAAALARQDDLQAKVTAARARLEDASAKAVAAAPDAELADAYERRQKLVLVREDERAMVEACAAASAAAAERVAGARRLLQDAQASAERVAKHRTEAEVAAKTHRLLSEVSARMATQIRPALEGQISAMLQTMSEGRFTSVKVSDDYAVTVADHDGRFYPVYEFSGGEADLIALSIRLALAQVVSARHGVGGAGFLILDEVFGSQDETRRRAILDGLRRLRSTYGQILLVSHVGGLEEAADTVIEVVPDEEDPQVARVTVT